ncbi:amidohydrolase family protein [Pseudonocardia sp. ICBG601]|uniref:amidohydrolase family protein n=1 Tax=Pseudonocardia sp. ICBG601 TaxID=2846759 RepID=UPI001CF6594A|nr:amidohydrolase family protein [Pseudonocardia sp. ICBG601]
MSDGTILEVGSRADVEAVAENEVDRYNFDDSTIMPGLIDAHVHLVFHGGPNILDTLYAEDDDTQLEQKMVKRAQKLLRAGVTTAQDLGDRNGLARRVRNLITSGEALGPRLLTAGAPLTVREGHCWFLGGVVDGEQEIRDRIRLLAAHGVDTVKIMASGGQLTPGPYAMWDPQFTLAELRAAVDEAHGNGLRIAAHAHSAAAIALAVEAGVDTIEHATWLVEGPDWDPRPEVAQQMAEQGTVLCHASSNDWRGLATKVGEAWARQLVGRVAWFDEYGVTQISGTDAGVTDFAGSATAVARFAEYGFSSGKAVEIGTISGAKALGLSHVTGSLVPGLAADLLIVDGNVLSDLSAITRPRLVISQGRHIVPQGSAP